MNHVNLSEMNHTMAPKKTLITADGQVTQVHFRPGA